MILIRNEYLFSKESSEIISFLTIISKVLKYARTAPASELFYCIAIDLAKISFASKNLDLSYLSKSAPFLPKT